MIISDYEYFLLFNNTSGTFSCTFSFSPPALCLFLDEGWSVGLYDCKPFKKKSSQRGRLSNIHESHTHTHTHTHPHNNYIRIYVYIVYTHTNILCTRSSYTEPTMYMCILYAMLRNENLLILIKPSLFLYTSSRSRGRRGSFSRVILQHYTRRCTTPE